MKIIHEIINRGKGSYGSGQNQITKDQLLRIYDESKSILSFSLTTFGSSGPSTYDRVTGILNVPNYTQQAIENFVPYTGATQNVNLGSNQLATDAIQFSLLPVGLDAVGKLKWNTDFGTLDIGMGYTDVVQRVGMDTYYPPVKNQTGSLILKGTVVMAVGTLGNSGRILVAPAVANGTVPSRYMLGITAADMPNGSDGIAIWFGELKKFNTVTKAPAGETWVDGDVLWINPAIPGGMTKVEPSAPNLKVSIAQIIHAGSNGIIVIRPSLGYRLTDLHDVNAFSPNNKDLISYNTSLGYWSSSSLGSVIGGISSQFVKGNGSLDSNSYEIAFSKGSLIQGSGITLSGTLTGRLVNSGNITIAAAVATSTTLGSVELFSDTVQSVVANAVTSTASRTYGIQLNSSGQMVVNVPWTDTNTIPTLQQVTSAGNTTTDSVNIGLNATPAAKLQVYQSATGTYMVAGTTATDRSLTFSSYTPGATTGNSHRITVPSSSGQLALRIGGSDKLIISSSETTSINRIRVKAPNYQYVLNDTNTNTDEWALTTVTSTNFGIYELTNAVDSSPIGEARLIIAAGGNVLINTEIDNGAKFQVNGGATLVGNLILDSSANRLIGLGSSSSDTYLLFNSDDSAILNVASGKNLNIQRATGSFIDFDGAGIRTHIGGIRTTAPVGTTSDHWKLGKAQLATSALPENRWIRVQIGLDYYDILAIYIGTEPT